MLLNVYRARDTTTRTTSTKLDHRTSLKSFMTKMKGMLKAEFGKLGRKRSNQTKINCLAVSDKFSVFIAMQQRIRKFFGLLALYLSGHRRSISPARVSTAKKWKIDHRMICVVERIFLCREVFHLFPRVPVSLFSTVDHSQSILTDQRN